MCKVQPESPKISALIITYNEIDNIADCLSSVEFASEIVVVDSYSTDGTYEYLSAHPRVRVIRNPFRNFTAQKNFALMHARHDWVLFIDADERVTGPLQQEILNAVANPAEGIDAYWFFREFLFRGKPLRFSGWQTDRNIRLFRKSRARYSGERIVHERLEVAGQTACLKHRLVHHCYQGYADYRQKMLLYGKLKAHEAFSRNRRFTYLKLVGKPLWRFFYNYVFRLGVLDGIRGVVICYLGALEDYQRYRILRQAEREYREAQCSLPRLSKEGFLGSPLSLLQQ